jgi:subtilisin family serine protease
MNTESGTSFACPLTAGVAALLLSKNHTLGPLDLKALLIETAEINVFENSLTEPGTLAPLSRMGGGEVRADRVTAASTAVWDSSEPLAVSMFFGTYRLNANQSFKKKLIVKNYSNTSRTYQIANSYRDAPNTTGVTLTAPANVTVAADSATSIALILTVNAASLPVWTLDGGTQGDNGELHRGSGFRQCDHDGAVKRTHDLHRIEPAEFDAVHLLGSGVRQLLHGQSHRFDRTNELRARHAAILCEHQ